jgi:polysaccharide biosynthesis transport protein
MNGILYDILHILFKRKAVIGVAFLVVILPVTLMAILRPLVYRAYVRLSVTQARAYPQISSRDEPRNLPLVDLTLINGAVNNIKSDDFTQKAAESIVQAGFPAGESGQSAKDWWAQKLTTGLEVTPIPSTPLIDIAYRTYPSQAAADIVNVIARRYLRYQAQAMADNSTLVAFYDSQRAIASRELRRADDALSRFQEKASIFSLDEQKLLLARAHTQALTDLDQNANKIRDAEAEAAALMARLKDLPPQLTLYTFGEDPKLAAVNTKVVSLELELNGLRQLYTDEDQRVKNSVEQLELARGLLEAEGEAARKTPNTERLETNLAYQQIMEAGLRQQAAAEGLAAGREELKNNVELTAARLQELNRLGFKYDRLKSMRDAKKAHYDLSLTQLEQSRTASALDVAGLTNVQAVNWAAAPDLPVPRGRVLMLLLGIVGAFVVGGASAFGMETVYPTIHARRDGEMRLDLPVIGVIPRLD